MHEKQFTLKELADVAGATIQGNQKAIIRRISTLQSATKESLSFLTNPSYAKYLKISKAGAVIMTSEVAETFTGNALIHKQPYVAFAKLSKLFDQSFKPPEGIHKTAVISSEASVHSSAIIGPNVVIEPGAIIEKQTRVDAGSFIGASVHIGSHTHIRSNSTLCHGTVIGKCCTIHEGVVIGSEGFGFAHDGQQWIHIAQLGKVLIGNNVEIGANTTIDRGTLDDTVIEDNVILDNQIQIAHNVKIGTQTAIAANAGIAGSTTIGSGCMIGGGANINGHLSIANDVRIAGAAIITKSITNEKSEWSPGGNRSQPFKNWRKSSARLNHLDELFKRVKVLEKRLRD